MMTHRERVLRTFAFKEVDKVAFDLMENTSWPELDSFFAKEYGLYSTAEILDFLDCDFRWAFAKSPYTSGETGRDHFADNISVNLLKDVESVEELERLFHPNPDNRIIPDFAAIREQYPDHAIVFCPLWMPAFTNCCMDFGMEEALCKMYTSPEIIEAYVEIHTECALEVLRRGIEKGAAKYCDFYWIGDDFATERNLMLHPDMWRRFFKPSIEKQVRMAREAGLKVIFHSCGAVESIYEDLIEIGISAHCGVQTSAHNMDIENLARKYGGRFVIYGGVDAQTTLINFTPEEVEHEVRRNIKAFENCGDYIVSNSHHGMADMPGENLIAMARGAGRIK
ncbi:MAG TPA: hypothetical protein GXX20_09335 [Clostridiaceae bacterium]|nr:hypothetical protein [Clostridiaceae bacterium]